jgi:aryl-alcohol dehydrogenase-like predicted oxidoreductase
MVSVVGLGCNNFGFVIDEQQSAAVIGAALDCGITLFDTSNHNVHPTRALSSEEHGIAEEFIGRAIKGHRHDVVIATKFGNDVNDGQDVARGSRSYIRRAVEDSLRRLDTDYIDLYQLHRRDPRTPIDETLATLDDLVREGKVRFVGSTNLTGWQITNADWVAKTTNTVRFISAQNRYNHLEREAEAEILPACEALGIGFLPFFPLANGLLTGKFRRGASPESGMRLSGFPISDAVLDQVETLERFALERSRTLLDVAVGGLAARPAVTSVIAGATKPEQVRANASAGEWEPTEEDQAALATVLGDFNEHMGLVVPPFFRMTV